MGRQPWEWRKPSPFSVKLLNVDRAAGEFLFHAYDVNDNAACERIVGLAVTVEEPNEGSRYCDRCIEFVQANPAGRDLRVAVDSGGTT